MKTAVIQGGVSDGRGVMGSFITSSPTLKVVVQVVAPFMKSQAYRVTIVRARRVWCAAIRYIGDVRKLNWRNTTMADIADRAQEVEEMQREAALAVRTAFRGDTADNCVECGSQIPSARQIALPGVQTCVGCAQQLEAAR